MAMDILEWIFENVMPWALLAVILFLFFLGIAGIISFYQYCRSPDFTLKKEEWECTKKVDVESTYYIMVGKVMVPQTSTTEECVQWTRKGLK